MIKTSRIATYQQQKPDGQAKKLDQRAMRYGRALCLRRPEYPF